jgi:hypothetical protein
MPVFNPFRPGNDVFSVTYTAYPSTFFSSGLGRAQSPYNRQRRVLEKGYQRIEVWVD